MKWIAVVLMLCLTGCSTFIVRDDDNTAEATGKVFTRVVFGLATMGWTEVFIKRAKDEEAWEANFRVEAAYLGQQCEKEGLTPGTEAYKGCIAFKYNQAHPPSSGGSGVGVVVAPPQQQRSVYCRTSSSGRVTTCW